MKGTLPGKFKVINFPNLRQQPCVDLIGEYECEKDLSLSILLQQFFPYLLKSCAL